MTNNISENNAINPEITETELKAASGMAALLLNTFLMLAFTAALVVGIEFAVEEFLIALGAVLIIVGSVYICIIGPILYIGLKVLKPNEALVLTLFGKYYGNLKGGGFYFVNPFATAVNPAAGWRMAASPSVENTGAAVSAVGTNVNVPGATGVLNKRISLKAMTLNNEKQKINDQLGNPIVIGIVVIWRVKNCTKAVFNVDNYKEYLSIQCDSALRDIVRLYPYDSTNDSEKSLRGSGQEIAQKIKEEVQAKVEIAGLEVMEARITHLSYSTEIAAAMLQRQQASAIIDARQMIVEGAVGMVEMALDKLSANNVVELDDERKAAMVSNLLVVLCGNRDAQPVVNSGTIY